MLARRNRYFAAAAWTAALATAVQAAGEVVDANRLGAETLPGGYIASAVIYVAAHVVGAAAWAVVATSFGDEINWRRLRLGGTIVVASFFAYYVGIVYRVIAVFASTHDSAYRHAYTAAAVAALLLALSAGAVVSGLTSKNRGPVRAKRLRLGGILVTISLVVETVSQLFMQAYWSAFSAPSEITIGTTILAIGPFVGAIGALFFARGAQRPLVRREAILIGAATLTVASTLMIAGGEALIATAYDIPAEPASLISFLWIAVASRVAFAVAFAFVALGARRAVDLRQPGPPAVDLG